MTIRRYLAIAILFFLLILPGLVNAQRQKQFSEDPVEFISDLTEFFMEDSRMSKKDARAELDTFLLFWNSGLLSKEQQQAVIATSNVMLKRKMTAYKQFTPYLEAVIDFGSSSQSPESFIQWSAVMSELAEKSQTRFLAFMELSSNLVLYKQLYNKSGVIWKSTSDEFTFSVVDGDPQVVFPSLDLICVSKNDSSVIYGTSGVFYPLDEKWQGDKGRVTWERAGYEAAEVYADFLDYSLSLNYSRYRIDSVNFHNTALFSYPLTGQLVENVQYNQSAERVNYPQFFSYESLYDIPNLFPGVDYRGGFSQRGAKMSASGSPDEKAVLTFNRDGKAFIVVKSTNFLVRQDRVSSENVEFVMYLEEDSIFHPGLQMRYTTTGNILSVFRSNEGMGLSPFFNTYHMLDMYVEEVAWSPGTETVHFKMMEGPGTVGESNFESSDYFSKARYDRIQGMENENPLSVVRKFCLIHDTREFNLEQFSAYMEFDPVQIKMYLLNLANLGFLVYDLDRDYVVVKDRVFRYINAVNKRIDYDVIRLHSEVVGKESASLSLLDFDLSVNGVRSMLLSDSQQVVIYPRDEKVTIRKNRDLVFAGRIHAGRFDFFGSNFYFSYDKFEVSLPVIDSVSFSVRGFETDADGWAPLRRVTTVIQDVAGSISVDRPDNKSGLQPTPDYPIFNCREYSFAYYDSKDIYDGVYPRTTFYYRIDPFIIDSLDNFSTEGLQFSGVFVSAGIFPDIYDNLIVMPDYSLGIVHNTITGLPAYGGRSKYFNTIRLSDEGLHGEGHIQYVSSESYSTGFTFFPDSATARLDLYEVKQTQGNPGFASVKGEDIAMLYRPYLDRMDLQNILKPFKLYNDFVEHEGLLTMRPDRLEGAGTITLMDAEIDSRNFTFGSRYTDADSCDFRLKATYAGYKLGEGDSEGWELMTYNYRAKIDFDEKEGVFRSNSGISNVMFTINQYMSFIDRFDWDMNSDKIELFQEKGSNLSTLKAMDERAQVDVKIIGPEFISTHPRQDSLRFFAESAVYNRKDNIITASGVPFIKVADAAIFPGNGVVTIFRKAEMQPLEKARILANLEEKYHLMFDALVTIRGKLDYSGKARYNYVDATGLEQVIKMHTVGVNDVLETYALGNVSDSAGFRLSPWFGYAGKVNLDATENFLLFDGGAQISHNCDYRERLWLKFTARVDPEKVAIPVSESPQTVNFTDIYFSFMSTSDSVRVYNAFLDRRLRGSDKKLISSYGFLVYDEPSSEYRVASAERLEDPFNTGNYLSLNTSTCNGFASGKMDLGTDYGQVNMEIYGNGEHFAREDSVQFDLAMLLDFFFSKDALEILVTDLTTNGSLGAADLGSEVFERAMLETMGKARSATYLEDLRLFGSVEKMPQELNKTFVLTDLQLHYNSLRRAYVTEGPISIANIGKTPINKSVDGRLEILRTRSSDEFTLYLELNPATWYYFSYERGRLMAVSSNPEFNLAIRETDPEDRRLKVEPGQTPYVYMLTTERSQKSFKRKYGDDEE